MGDPTPGQVIAVVADEAGISAERIKSDKTDAVSVAARAVVAKILLDTGKSTARIARVLDRHRTAVLHLLGRCDSVGARKLLVAVRERLGVDYLPPAHRAVIVAAFAWLDGDPLSDAALREATCALRGMTPSAATSKTHLHRCIYHVGVGGVADAVEEAIGERPTRADVEAWERWGVPVNVERALQPLRERLDRRDANARWGGDG